MNISKGGFCLNVDYDNFLEGVKEEMRREGFGDPTDVDVDDYINNHPDLASAAGFEEVIKLIKDMGLGLKDLVKESFSHQGQ